MLSSTEMADNKMMQQRLADPQFLPFREGTRQLKNNYKVDRRKGPQRKLRLFRMQKKISTPKKNNMDSFIHHSRQATL